MTERSFSKGLSVIRRLRRLLRWAPRKLLRAVVARLLGRKPQGRVGGVDRCTRDPPQVDLAAPTRVSARAQLMRALIITALSVLAFLGVTATVQAGVTVAKVSASEACSDIASARLNRIVGTPGPDILIGTAGRDRILGRGGDDIIRGLGRSDHLCGGPGNDTIYGGGTRGTNYIFGGPGRDRIHGGAG